MDRRRIELKGGIKTIGDHRVRIGLHSEIVGEVFDLRPYFIIERLKLKRPIFRKTTNYGHLGRELPEFTWEQTDAVQDLRTACRI